MKANNGSTISINGSVASCQKNDVSATDGDQSKIEKDGATASYGIKKIYSD